MSVRYLFVQEKGASPARNRGIRQANGEILCFLDDDAAILVDANAAQEIAGNIAKILSDEEFHTSISRKEHRRASSFS